MRYLRIGTCAAIFAAALAVSACGKQRSGVEKKAVDDPAPAPERAAHNAVRTELHSAFEAYERKATSLKQRVATATPDTKKSAAPAVTALDARRDAANMSMVQLADDSPATWERATNKAEEDVAAVGRALDALESTLDNK